MFPVQITTKDIPISAAIDTLIRKRSNKLSQFYNHISSCRVVIDMNQKHKHQGKLYTIRIDTTVPGKELVVTKKHDQDIYVAIRNAFNAIQRQIEEYAHKRHGRIKLHDVVSQGRIVRMLPEEGYGFIEGNDGHEYYFSLTNVSYPDFSKLFVGDLVSYIPDIVRNGEGRQAHRISKEK